MTVLGKRRVWSLRADAFVRYRYRSVVVPRWGVANEDRAKGRHRERKVGRGRDKKIEEEKQAQLQVVGLVKPVKSQWWHLIL